jgi:protein-S-isoprenylcysteine O-methyltransferase Ste14
VTNDGVRALFASLGAGFVVLVICGLSYLILEAAELPERFGSSLLGWAVGSFLIALGLLWAGWVFVYRTPKGFFLSTFFTFKKALTRADPSVAMGRSEPFIVDGPYLYVRNPTYFGACSVVLGLGLVTGLSFLLLASLGLGIWFNGIVMPYEEREMKALFGQDYVTYTKMVPAFFPSGKAMYGRSAAKRS